MEGAGMRIIVEYDGKVYESSETLEVTQDQCVAALYKEFSHTDKIKMQLAGGDWIIFGKDVVQRAIIRVKA